MHFEKRLVVWLLETLIGAFLEGILLVAEWGATKGDVPGDVLLLVAWITIISVISGYALTTLICRLTWTRQKLLWYPIVATLLLIVHGLIFMKFTDMGEPSQRLQVLGTGGCVVLLLTFLGSYTLRRWEDPDSGTPNETPASLAAPK